MKNREEIDKKIYYKILENNIPDNITKSKGIKLVKKTGWSYFLV